MDDLGWIPSIKDGLVHLRPQRWMKRPRRGLPEQSEFLDEALGETRLEENAARPYFVIEHGKARRMLMMTRREVQAARTTAVDGREIIGPDELLRRFNAREASARGAAGSATG